MILLETEYPFEIWYVSKSLYKYVVGTSIELRLSIVFCNTFMLFNKHDQIEYLETRWYQYEVEFENIIEKLYFKSFSLVFFFNFQ